ncbi:expressed unknown protein [Seminavis robusta]|uniref:YCII-related domain-containing protein n=1 Tax=Seminavis robusta TaxID=568900 RepID=A0A9N8DC43_9STRA|nr:expressed unknown protein [Seminavis robusta]|eukprot:Sro30_g019590.1 n/a (358) ;mRNA; r:70689-71874
MLRCCLLLLTLVVGTTGFSSIGVPGSVSRSPSARYMSSFSVDGSEYSSKDSDYVDDDEFGGGEFSNGYRDPDDTGDSPTVEMKPVPMSKNAGNRFVAFVWDRLLDTENRDQSELHHDRIDLTEDHVMFCRKTNLYSDEFNTESMVDILFSRQLLSSDLRRTIGHAFCMESTELLHIQELMKNEPIINMLTEGDISNIPLYRWRHIRDYSLRVDDGRFGCPCMLVATDHEPEEVGNLRADVWDQQMEALIRSERIIAAGPLHLPTELKDDEASALAVGDMIMFNAKNRDEAVEFVESLPYAQEGLYQNMKVHFYNTLDTTGKFVSEDPLRDSPCEQMQEALDVWGYPTGDDQTPWLNW